jgi:hypothetical protein
MRTPRKLQNRFLLGQCLVNALVSMGRRNTLLKFTRRRLRRRVAGSLRTCLLNAPTTSAVSLLGTLISMTKRDCLASKLILDWSSEQISGWLKPDDERQRHRLADLSTLQMHLYRGRK